MTAPTDFVDVPSGALCGATVTLTCKGPDEERSYFLEYDSQLDPDDYIVSVTGAAGDTDIAITNITVLGRRFRFTLTGGTLNQTSGIEFTMDLKSGDIRTLICVVSIEAQGVLQSGTIPVIMGSQGARGVTLFTGDTDPTPEYTPPSGWAVLANDLYLNVDTNALYQASASTTGITWSVIAQLGNPTSELPTGYYYIDQNGFVRYSKTAESLPDDVSLNGDVYMAGSSTLPKGLSSNGSVIMSDETNYYTGTCVNGGVLSVNPNK